MSKYKKVIVMLIAVPLIVVLSGFGYIKYKRSTNVSQGVYIPLPLEEPNYEYDLYYGNTHAHTNDRKDIGHGTFAEALAYARDESNLDFLILSPHLGSVSDESFVDMTDAVAEATVDGEFVAWAGQEMDTSAVMLDCPSPAGVPGGAARLENDPFARESGPSMHNHIVEWFEPLFSGTALYVGADEHSPVFMGVWRDVYDWTEEDDLGFGIFFHPQVGDFGDFYSAEADNSWTTADLFVNEDPFEPDFDFSEWYLWLLSEGWHVGASASYRNLAEWGSLDVGTGVWADGLTSARLTEAFRARRTYATQAPDLRLMLRANGYTMGQEITANGSKVLLTVDASDPNLSVARIELYEGVYGSGQPAQIIEIVEPNEAQVNWTYTIPSFRSQKYFLVKLVMSDGAKAWSSPIWIQGTLQ